MKLWARAPTTMLLTFHPTELHRDTSTAAPSERMLRKSVSFPPGPCPPDLTSINVEKLSRPRWNWSFRFRPPWPCFEPGLFGHRSRRSVQACIFLDMRRSASSAIENGDGGRTILKRLRQYETYQTRDRSICDRFNEESLTFCPR